MLWPIKGHGAKLLRIASDETDGRLSVWASFEDDTERELVYEGMYYSQLDERTTALTVTSVAEITPRELPHYTRATVRFFNDCGADYAFVTDMCARGNHLYLHQTREGGVYLVLAKRLAYGEIMSQQNKNKA